MRTQSTDTSVETEQVLIKLIRGAPMYKRFRPVQAMTQRTFWANTNTWQLQHPEASEKEAAVHFVALLYGVRLAEQVRASLSRDDDWRRQPVDIARLLSELGAMLEEAKVSWYLGGSLASSLYGMPQLAQDIDLVVHGHSQSIASLSAPLARSFIFDENDVQATTIKQISLPLIHRDSLIKVDLIQANPQLFGEAFCLKPSFHVLDERYKSVCIASATEMLLFKLHRYQQNLTLHTNGMQDDAEWNDILGMLKVQGLTLDLAFLEQWSQGHHIYDLYCEALEDAGLHRNR